MGHGFNDFHNSQKGAVGVRQPYIRVVGLEQARESNSGSSSTFTIDEVRLIFLLSVKIQHIDLLS